MKKFPLEKEPFNNMKWLLNFIPRPLLISLSIWFRPFIKLYFKGTRFTDPIDGSSYRKFLPYGYRQIS